MGLLADNCLLSNIRKASDTMRIVCNAGMVVVDMMGDFLSYGTVWFHEDAITNTLSLSNVQKRFKVTYHRCHDDTSKGNCFVLHRTDGPQRVFKYTGRELYTSQVLAHQQQTKLSEVTTVMTVEGNI